MTEEITAYSGVADDRIRVLVVGESPLVRTGLEAALSRLGSFEVVGTTNRAGAPGADACETQAQQKPPVVALTPREIEVLRLLAEGASNKMIAHQLGISDHTAKFHVGSILSKMNAGTRTEAVTLGMRMGLVYL